MVLCAKDPVHGIVFWAYRRFLADRFGAAMASQAFSELGTVSARAVYEDQLFTNLVQSTAGLASMGPDLILHEFGTHALSLFYELYPSYFPSEGARRFLLQVEELIHARVREVIAGAAPPQLRVSDLGGGIVRIEYQSKRSLCPMLAGFLDGTSIHYQTPIRYSEEKCMRRGDPACIFMISVQQTLLPKTTRTR